jgi:thiol-disulfide isomerase/thioredoxin
MSYSTYKNIGKDSITQQTPANIPPAVIIKDKNHRNNIIFHNDIVIIYNFTNWCGPCKQIAAPYDILSDKYRGRASLVKENVDDEIENAPQVTGVPAFHFYIKGKYYEDLNIVGGDLEMVETQLLKIIEKVALHK